MAKTKILRAGLTVAFACFLAACGGGSSGAPTSGGGGGGSGGGGSNPGQQTTYAPGGNISTVEGVDSAHRGYRDDVQQLIDDEWSTVPAVRAGAESVAKVFQTSITSNALNMPDTSSLVLAAAQAGTCAAANAGADHVDEMMHAINAVYARTFNTDARIAARQQYLALVKNVGVLKTDRKLCSSAGGTQ
jgi:hypothetical protein